MDSGTLDQITHRKFWNNRKVGVNMARSFAPNDGVYFINGIKIIGSAVIAKLDYDKNLIEFSGPIPRDVGYGTFIVKSEELGTLPII